jgi:hypothetical protein
LRTLTVRCLFKRRMPPLRPLRALCALLWMVATLWRATGGPCVHHAPSHDAQRLVATDAAPHDHAAHASEAPATPQDQPQSPCDCSDDCCGTTAFVAPLPVVSEPDLAPRAGSARMPVQHAPHAAESQRRLPPATAPPSLR